jgi:hypothetical protein
MIDYAERNSLGGSCSLWYGPTGSGKTYAAITLVDPILFINKEPKDPRLVHRAVLGENGLHVLPNGKLIKYVEPESFDDEMEFLNKLVSKTMIGESKFKSVFHDGLTFTQASYKHDIEDSRYIARTRDPKEIDRGLIDRFRFERPDWGAIGSMMSRETLLLNKLSKFGIHVVSTAIDSEYPKWNTSYAIAPALQGNDFPKLVHGYFDFIGYVLTPFCIEHGKLTYPRISFIQNPDSMGTGYMARSNSDKLIEAELKNGPPPLDFERILKVIRG